MNTPSVEEVVKALRAKAWQSAGRRNSAGNPSKHTGHVCWQAADLLEAQAEQIVMLQAGVAFIVQADEEAKDHGGLKDCQDNNGAFYQSQWLDCLLDEFARQAPSPSSRDRP
jgi:hypothetical protein